MAYTNKTVNYELPQYVADDKPTYLGDFNSAMSKIDEVMKTNADSVTDANGQAANAVSQAQQASTTATSALNEVNTVKSQITTINEKDSQQDTTISGNSEAITTLQDKVSTNETDIKTIVDFIDLSNIQNYSSQITTNIGQVDTSQTTVTVATNKNGSYGKIYGRIRIMNISVPSGTRELQVTIPNTPIRPNTNMTIIPGGFARNDKDHIDYLKIDVDTSGNITIRQSSINNTYIVDVLFLFPCIYYFKDFGDSE